MNRVNNTTSFNLGETVMGNFNKVILMGNLTSDPEYKQFGKSQEGVNFAVAVNRKWTTQSNEEMKETSYVDCCAYGGQAKTISKFFKKGRPILLEGRLKQERWEKEGKKFSRMRVVVESFEFVDSGKKKEDEAIAEKPYSEDMGGSSEHEVCSGKAEESTEFDSI